VTANNPDEAWLEM